MILKKMGIVICVRMIPFYVQSNKFRKNVQQPVASGGFLITV